MPLVPPMTTGIIVYETTAIGAILAALLRMLWETKLPDFKHLREDYAVEIDEGVLVVSVPAGANEEEIRTIIEQSM